MYVVRRWATCNAGLLNRLYRIAAGIFHTFDPLWCRIGARFLETPFAVGEAWTKGFLFDCTMCRNCVLSVTGMTCPTKCPKSLRDRPCGGVRPNGHCEVKSQMRCVWVEAWAGATSMQSVKPFSRPLPPREYSIEGKSAWLHLAAENEAWREAAQAKFTAVRNAP